VLHSFAPPATRVQGNAAARLPGDPINFVRRLNVLLGDLAPPSVQLLDVAGLVEEHGMTRWFDPRYWYLAKQPIAFAALPAYVRSLAGLARARHGRSRKCVVVDLDNTLWGGVVADDGVAGIELGEGSPTGEAFRAFQRYLRELKRRGVLLAVCSKNDEDVARLPFERHPDMLLRTDDFVAFKANWAAKSQNLAAIADELGLPTDSLVFVDDNPAERDEVRRAGLGVWVVELSDDPSQFPALIERDRLFDASVLSAEDLDRTEAYRGRARAEHRRSSATDLNAFLRSLEMHARVEPIAPESAARVEQLLNKTNQFNLTGRRVTAAEIERVMKAPGWLARTLRVWDRFADHGLISVVYGEVLGTVLEIENWVTSCRVLDRGCEALLLSELLRDARERGVKTIRGTYRPTERNARVRELFPSLGFEPIDDTGGVTRWSLPVAAHVPRPTWITLVIGP
jgi:FkbH-like protein